MCATSEASDTRPFTFVEAVNTAVIIIVLLAAIGVLLMRFRKRWLAKINIAVTNRITNLFTGWLPGFGILLTWVVNRVRSIAPQ